MDWTMHIPRFPRARPWAALLFAAAALASCGVPPPPAESPFEERGARFLNALSWPRLEFWPQKFSSVNAFGRILSAPLQGDKQFREFKASYFNAAAAGIDMAGIDRTMAAAFEDYDRAYAYEPLAETLRALTSSLRAANTPGIPPSAFRYAAMGASESMGAGARPPSQAWVYLTAKRLEQRFPAVAVRNFADGGKTTEHARAVQLPKVLEFQPDLVTYAAGLNDLQYGVPVETAKANTECISRELRARTHAKVVIASVSVASRLPLFQINVPKLRQRRANLSPERIDAFNAAFRDLADRYGALLADLGELLPESAESGEVESLFSYDGVHPNNKGHARMAEVFWPKIEAALVSPQAPPPN